MPHTKGVTGVIRVAANRTEPRSRVSTIVLKAAVTTWGVYIGRFAFVCLAYVIG